jgi:hypothetical protein
LSTEHVFVDETKHHGYLLVAAAVLPGDLDLTRKIVRSLVPPGQRRLHMKAEGDRRRRCIAAVVAGTEVRAVVYDAGPRWSRGPLVCVAFSPWSIPPVSAPYPHRPLPGICANRQLTMCWAMLRVV